MSTDRTTYAGKNQDYNKKLNGSADDHRIEPLILPVDEQCLLFRIMFRFHELKEEIRYPGCPEMILLRPDAPERKIRLQPDGSGSDLSVRMWPVASRDIAHCPVFRMCRKMSF